jgi:hypothetical protein
MTSFAVWTAALLVCPAVAFTQQFRGRVDTRAQALWFRGLISDSIEAAAVVPSPNGGFETPDGYAVRCGAGSYCFYRRPGPTRHGVPLTTGASVVAWDLGINGLTFRATGRVNTDVSSGDAWPGTSPSAQLIEGFFEYERSAATVARIGRQQVASRLEPIGFDGGWVRYRWDRPSLEVTGYGGWGLGQAVAVSVLSPALNPLDEWRPRDRQLVAGAEAAMLYRALDVRTEYRREIDPESDYFVSERAALSFGARSADLRLTGGLDYNIAEGHFGSSDVTVTYLQRFGFISAAARRYRPYFSLWTLWGAFSPVPYNAMSVSTSVRVASWLSLNARGERYWYEGTEVSTAVVPALEDRGWRTRAGADAALNSRWSIDASYGLEHGPGASSRSADVSVSYMPNEAFDFDLYAGSLARPLELRYYDASSRWLGVRGQSLIGSRWRLWSDLALVSDNRDRPDAAAWALDQFRARSGVTYTFGSSADQGRLPPARRPVAP